MQWDGVIGIGMLANYMLAIMALLSMSHESRLWSWIWATGGVMCITHWVEKQRVPFIRSSFAICAVIMVIEERKALMLHINNNTNVVIKERKACLQDLLQNYKLGITVSPDPSSLAKGRQCQTSNE